MKWIDAELHILPPKWCDINMVLPDNEDVMRRILWDHPLGEMALNRADESGIIAEMERCGVNGGVLLGMPWNSPAMCWGNNEYVLEVARRHAGRFVCMGILPDPAQEDPLRAVKRIEAMGFAGVKVIPSWHRYRLNDTFMQPVYEYMTEAGLVLMPHTDHLFLSPDESDTPFALFDTARSHPELKILAPHLGGLLALYGLRDPIRPTLENIMFVTSTPATMPMVSYALDAMGSDHIAFGSDFPFNAPYDMSVVKTALEEMGLDPGLLEQLAGGNIQRWLGGWA